MEDRVTGERLNRYFRLTEEAVKTVRIAAAKKGKLYPLAEDMLDMARNYLSDAGHFAAEGKIVDAFACLNYAYGWIDAGARLGLFEVGEDYRRFTLGR